MSNIKVINLLLTFYGFVKASHPTPEPRGLFLPANNQILATIDAVFATLKIDQNFTKSKNIAHYLSLHHFVKDTVEKNDKIYQIIGEKCKYTSSHKTGVYISNIDKVVAEMIRMQKVNISKDFFHNNRSNYRDLIQKRLVTDFIQFAKGFHLRLYAPSPNDLLGVVQEEKWPEREGGGAGTRRIFNGTATRVARYPFMASLHVRGRFVCAGSLIRTDLIITAASGLIPIISPQSDPRSVKARVGSDYTNKFGKLVPVAGFHFHPKFNWTTLRCNLVIIHLKKRLKLENGKLTAIQYDTTANYLPANVKKIIILGWGEKKVSPDVGYKYDGSNQKLLLARLDLQDLNDCKDTYSRTYVSNKHFCASSDSNAGGACQFDVGGPAVAGHTLVGVASFGASRCGERDAPTVFTKLGFYADWIESVIKEVPPCRQPIHQKPQSVNEPVPDDASADEKWYYLNLLKTSMKSATEKELQALLNELEEEDDIYKETTTYDSRPFMSPHQDILGSINYYQKPPLPSTKNVSIGSTNPTSISPASTSETGEMTLLPASPASIPPYQNLSVFSGTTTTESAYGEYSFDMTPPPSAATTTSTASTATTARFLPGLPLQRMGESFYYEHYLRNNFPNVRNDHHRNKKVKRAPTMWGASSMPQFSVLDKKNPKEVLNWQNSKRSLQVPFKISSTYFT